jgi:pimeloyl-ACP methyl ester carboxylesterase
MVAAVSPKAAAAYAFRIFCTPLKGRARSRTLLAQHGEPLQVTVENKLAKGLRWNKGGSKKALLLHGMHSSSRNFERYVEPLVEKGFEVIAFDAPAHGDSEGKQITVLQYRIMIAEIFNAFGPIDAYLAHSFGGLATSLALENIPHDSQTRVVLIAPATETVTAVNQFFNFLRINGELRREFDQIILERGGQPTDWYSVKRAMAAIQASILWFHDKDDDVTPLSDVQPIIDRNYANIEFVITENWGHRRIYREQKVINQAVKFLAS